MDVRQRMLKGTLVNGLAVRVNADSHDDRPEHKLAQMRVDDYLADHIASRQDHCWLCERTPVTWVREVVFDLGDNQEMPVRTTALAVDSRHYPGPVPGFCGFHLGSGPAQLAEIIYNDHEVITWGYRPSRWFVMFTDGSMARGKAIQIDAKPELAPITHDRHERGNDGD